MRTGHIKGSTSDSRLKLIAIVVSTFYKFNFLNNKIKILSETLDFRRWAESNFEGIKFFHGRKKLLMKALKVAEKNSKLKSSPLLVLEFGVAYGETSEFLIKNIESEYHYFGFDSFLGLPESWRNLPKSTFSTEGIPPVSQSSNVQYVVGWIENTVPIFQMPKDIGSRFVIFDLDLYGPTLFVYDHIRNYLVSGDVLYFDEAFDADERLIIREYLLKDFEVEALGMSPQGLVFQIKSRRENFK